MGRERKNEDGKERDEVGNIALGLMDWKMGPNTGWRKILRVPGSFVEQAEVRMKI